MTHRIPNLFFACLIGIFSCFAFSYGMAADSDYDSRVCADPSSLGEVEMYCDPVSSRLFIVNRSGYCAASCSLPKKRVIDWSSLLVFTEDKGDFPHRAYSRIASYRCGVYKVSFESGYINPNPNGKDGQVDFPRVRIYKGRKALTKSIVLDQCGWFPEDHALWNLDKYPKYCAVAVAVKPVSGTKKTIITYIRTWERNSKDMKEESEYVLSK